MMKNNKFIILKIKINFLKFKGEDINNDDEKNQQTISLTDKFHNLNLEIMMAQLQKLTFVITSYNFI